MKQGLSSYINKIHIKALLKGERLSVFVDAATGATNLECMALEN